MRGDGVGKLTWGEGRLAATSQVRRFTSLLISIHSGVCAGDRLESKYDFAFAVFKLVVVYPDLNQFQVGRSLYWGLITDSGFGSWQAKLVN